MPYDHIKASVKLKEVKEEFPPGTVHQSQCLCLLNMNQGKPGWLYGMGSFKMRVHEVICLLNMVYLKRKTKKFNL